MITREGLVIDDDSRQRLAERLFEEEAWLYGELARRARGEYHPDEHLKGLPPWERPTDQRRKPALNITLTSLLDLWAKERPRRERTLYEWRRVVKRLVEHLGHDDPERVAKKDIVAWKDALIASGMAAKTVKNHVDIVRAAALAAAGDRASRGPRAGSPRTGSSARTNGNPLAAGAGRAPFSPFLVDHDRGAEGRLVRDRPAGKPCAASIADQEHQRRRAVELARTKLHPARRPPQERSSELGGAAHTLTNTRSGRNSAALADAAASPGRVARSRALWLTVQGQAISATHAHLRITRHTARAFGRSVNPHLFRDAVATTIALMRPDKIGIVTPLLGHRSLATAHRSYNLAGMAAAAVAWHDVLDELSRS